MRLISCKIENFGKFSNTTIEFNEGLNAICRENGWGKSTLAAFIRVMLYGFENETVKKDAEILKERVRYMPWAAPQGIYGGTLCFEANGKRYSLFREFKEKSGNDRFELRDLDTNLESDDFSHDVGKELFGITSEAFAHTVFIGQRSVATAFDPSISAKIGNMEAVADDISNYEKTETTLNELINKYDAGRKNSETGKLSAEVTELAYAVRGKEDAEANVESLSTALQNETNREAVLREQKAALEKERTDTAEYIAKAAIKDRYDALCREEEERNRETAEKKALLPDPVPNDYDISDFRQKLKAFREIEREIFVKKGKLSALTSNPEPQVPGKAGRIVTFILALLAVGAGVLLYFLGIPYPLFCIPAIPAVILLIVFLILCGNAKKAQKRKDDYDRPIADIKRELIKDTELSEMRWESITGRLRNYGLDPEGDPEEQINVLENNLLLYNAALENLNVAEKKRVAFEGADEYDAVLTIGDTKPAHTLDEIGESILANNEETENCRRLIRQYGEDLEASTQRLEEIVKKEELLEKKRAELDEKVRRGAVVRKALEYLKKAKENYEREFTEPLKSGFDKYYSILAGKDPSKYKMDVKGTLTVEEYGRQRDLRNLSAGYRDLAGLCLRMAMIEVMYKEEPPFIIFDDPLTELDDEKVKLGTEFMKAVSEKYQVIWFSCREARD